MPRLSAGEGEGEEGENKDGGVVSVIVHSTDSVQEYSVPSTDTLEGVYSKYKDYCLLHNNVEVSRYSRAKDINGTDLVYLTTSAKEYSFKARYNRKDILCITIKKNKSLKDLLDYAVERVSGSCYGKSGVEYKEVLFERDSLPLSETISDHLEDGDLIDIL